MLLSDIEKAVLVYRFKDINIALKYDRLYYGYEFCERLLPTKDELKKAIEFSVNHGKKFTFLTSYVSDTGIERIKELLKVIKSNLKQLIQPEVVVNDLGIMNLLEKEKDITIIAGRLLVKQKRDPRINYLNLSNNEKDYFKQFSLDSDNNQCFISKFGIKRIELDNTFQGIKRQSNLQASLYVPYCYVTTTKLCYMAKADKHLRYLRKIEDCDKQCQKYDVYMTNDKMKTKFYLKGNTVFYRNDKIQENIKELNINRIVSNVIL